MVQKYVKYKNDQSILRFLFLFKTSCCSSYCSIWPDFRWGLILPELDLECGQLSERDPLVSSSSSKKQKRGGGGGRRGSDEEGHEDQAPGPYEEEEEEEEEEVMFLEGGIPTLVKPGVSEMVMFVKKVSQVPVS